MPKTLEQSTEEETMQLQRNDLSPEAVKIIETTPKVELEKLLGVDQFRQTPVNKWVKLTEEIENDTDFDDLEFAKAWEAMKEGAQDFRKNFKFKHDLT